MNFDKEFDASGLSCPLPILKTKKALSDMTSGQVLKLVATDSGSVKDMQAFADQTGNALLATEEAKGAYIFYMKKK
jgi:tRNA 2-thiouridine synthesizing protein A